ncbi:TPA: hypothetical protein QCI19_002316 [Enterobacter ludwigii]|nr:hypothetical protein [Enterobacter ludwigii]
MMRMCRSDHAWRPSVTLPASRFTTTMVCCHSPETAKRRLRPQYSTAQTQSQMVTRLFQGGARLTAAGDIIQDTSTGIWYRWDDLSSLPKNVPAGSTPASTGGTGEGKWPAVDVTDILRQQLADGDGSLVGLGGKTVADLGKAGGASLVVAADDRNVDQWLVALDTAEYC